MIRQKNRRRATFLAAATLTAGFLGPIGAALPAHASYTTCRPSPDTVPPTVDSVTFDQSTIDLSNGPATITVNVHATDDGNVEPSGVRMVRIQFESKFDEFHGRLALTSGSRNSGTWSRTFTVPTTTVSDSFHTRLVEVRDGQQNTNDYIREGRYPQNPLDPRLQAGWGAFTVSGGAAQTILPRGTVKSFTFNRSVVSTTHHPGTIRATASFAGTQPRIVLLYLRGRSHLAPLYFTQVHLRPASTGTWSRRITVPQWTGDAAVHAELGLTYPGNVKPPRHIVRFTGHALRRHEAFRIHGNADSTEPTLSELTVDPSIDTTAGPQRINVSATTEDDQSGVGRVVIRFFAHSGRRIGFAYAKLTQSGDVWSGTAKIPACSTSGAWRIGVYLADKAGNHIDYGPSRLGAAGFANRLEVTSRKPGHLDGPELTGSSASGTDHTITLDFTGVVNVNTSTLTIYDLLDTPARFSTPTAISGISCSGGALPVACDGSGGAVTSAVLSVPTLRPGERAAILSNQDSVTPQLSDTYGNPLGWGQITTVTAS